jgi:hypothetical protein
VLPSTGHNGRLSEGWASVLDMSTDLVHPDPTQLACLGNVPDDYQHTDKRVCPAPDIALPGGYLKWYDIHRDGAEIPSGTRIQARDFLRSEATAGRLDLHDELGFVLLHRCGESYYFLLVCTWRNHNEMWQTLYSRDGDNDAFGPVEHEDQHRPAQCVWELGATAHERLAWTRYLTSDRDDTAKRDYLADRFAGPV